MFVCGPGPDPDPDLSLSCPVPRPAMPCHAFLLVFVLVLVLVLVFPVLSCLQLFMIPQSTSLVLAHLAVSCLGLLLLLRVHGQG